MKLTDRVDAIHNKIMRNALDCNKTAVYVREGKALTCVYGKDPRLSDQWLLGVYDGSADKDWLFGDLKWAEQFMP